jgi:hypothetical protein
VLLCADAAAAFASLAGGLLACPSCRTGQLARWGHGRERTIRLLNGATTRLRPDRARCRACGRTHILLPSWCAPRRADAIEVIGTGLAAALGGVGSARINADLGVPSGTVRSWLRRLRSRAEEMRCFAMGPLGAIGGTYPALPGLPTRRCMTRSTQSPRPRTPPSPGTASPQRTCGRCWASPAWPAISRPPAPAKDPAPSRALPCPQSGRVTGDDHHRVSGPAHRDTVSNAPPP